MRSLPGQLFRGAFLAAASPLLGAPTAPLPYLDPAQPLEARASDLVARLTLDEKASLMRNTSPGVPRLGIPPYDWWSEALHGVARAGPATVFPQAIGLAAMWDDDFLQQIAGTIGVEARAKFHEDVRHGQIGERFHGLTFWSPNVNIFRDPRWGRGQETYGEDPFLTSRLGIAFVRGLQGADPRYLLAAACAKHFAVHSGPEPLRHHFNVDPDEADFFDTYLPAFEALVREAHVEAVMTAYNSVYGQPCSINDRLYDLLYHRWHFDGHVVSDCGSIADLYRHYHVVQDGAEAEALSVKAGLCVRCGDEPPALAEAVRRGLIPEREVDDRLHKLLRTMFRLGFFDPPDQVRYTRIPFSENDSSAHGRLALEAARQSIVLLKNDGTLPLRPGLLHRLAVIGPNADSVAALVGNYNGTPSAPVTVLAGLRAALGPAVAIDYAKGCDYVTQPVGLAPIPPTSLHYGELTGLQGAYFANDSLAGAPDGFRRDRPVDLDFSKDELPRGVPGPVFSVRWTGDVRTRLAGEYRLGVAANGGFRLFLGDELVIDAWSPGKKNRTITRQLPADTRYPIRLEYHGFRGPARVSLQWSVPPADADFATAIATARAADVIVFVGGITAELEGEEMRLGFDGFSGGDRTRIELPEVQERLLHALQAMGKPVVFVQMSGSAIAIPWADAHLNAIVQAWYPGQAGGAAVADVLLGRTNPSGRLPVTFYRSTGDLPAFEDYHMSNRTYRYFREPPLYAFGYGLSYTTFAYANLRAAPATPGTPATLSVSIDVTNTGGRDGDEIVQLYAQEPVAAHPRAVQSLCGFRRIHLARGETRTVTVAVPATALRRWSVEKKDYLIPAGAWRILAGASSVDIRQAATVELPSP